MKISQKTATCFTNKYIKPKLLIIHHTATFGNCANYLANPSDGRKVSAHFMIHTDGTLYVYSNLISVVDKWAKRAWHAGKSCWNYIADAKYDNDKDTFTNVNDFSIGIELTGDGNKKPYPIVQMKSLYEISIRITRSFPDISSPAKVLGHSDISLAGKVDPGKYFDWDAFELNVFGKDENIKHK